MIDWHSAVSSLASSSSLLRWGIARRAASSASDLSAVRVGFNCQPSSMNLSPYVDHSAAPDQLTVVDHPDLGGCWQICSGGVCLQDCCGHAIMERYRALRISQGRPVPAPR